jgi:aromatic ring-opening dioxygenase catalytic subunit (LigB family)
MLEQLGSIAAQIERPAAILVVSAHWEASVVSITHGARPPLIYDYFGFPPQAYAIQYPAPGAPALAETVYSSLQAHGIRAELDDARGFDHGLYVPLLLMYPQADIPCVQLSLAASLDAGEHIRIGTALADLHRDQVLIIGSGFSFHNMRAFAEEPTSATQAMNAAFQAWLVDTCSSTTISEAERSARLTNWENAPHARYCHPREEHLLPLQVCYGASKRACTSVITTSIMRRKASFCLW